jgi:hypothetical protein
MVTTGVPPPRPSEERPDWYGPCLVGVPMAYYFNVVALCVGAALCFVLGRALFEMAEPTPAPVAVQAQSAPTRVVRADAGHAPRK